MSWDSLFGLSILRKIRMDVRHPFDEHANGAALQLGKMSIFVFEDPDDGYRSHAGEPLIAEAELIDFGCYGGYGDTLAVPVLVRQWEGSNGIELIDTRNGKTILRLGTDMSDGYYPCFTCEWRPEDLADNAPQGVL